MKKKRHLLLASLNILSVVTTAAFLCFMPDKIPIRYGNSGEVVQTGSKYVNILWPLFSLFITAIFVGSSRRKHLLEKEKSLLFLSALITQLFFFAVSVFFMACALLFSP